ncbi:MAG: hypothetical protein ABEJ65_05955 [bacterium]
MDGAGAVGSSQLAGAGSNAQSKEAGGGVKQQLAVKAAADAQQQQQQKGQNALSLIEASGIGQNVNTQA